MFGSTKSNTQKPSARIDSLIGAGTRIEGDVSFNGGLRIDGEVRGNVTGLGGDGSTLVLSEQAIVEGEVRVGHLVVNGSVKGPIHASETLELQPRARVSGDVHYNTLEMHQGAAIDGRLVHRSVDQQAEQKPIELKIASKA
jgi:cytoskeletal protein CcmA (bactofilin family)